MTMIKNCNNTRLDVFFCVTTQQAQNICITFVQRRPNLFGVGPTNAIDLQVFCVYWVVTLFVMSDRRECIASN